MANDFLGSVELTVFVDSGGVGVGSKAGEPAAGFNTPIKAFEIVNAVLAVLSSSVISSLF
ncbi:hypothetical protein D9M71_823890 [compost metagenome]